MARLGLALAAAVMMLCVAAAQPCPQVGSAGCDAGARPPPRRLLLPSTPRRRAPPRALTRACATPLRPPSLQCDYCVSDNCWRLCAARNSCGWPAQPPRGGQGPLQQQGGGPPVAQPPPTRPSPNNVPVSKEQCHKDGWQTGVPAAQVRGAAARGARLAHLPSWAACAAAAA